MGQCFSQLLKVVIYVLGNILIISCSKKDDSPPKDCNCNRVLSSNSFNLPDGSTFGTFWTINDCTGLQSTGKWSNTRPQNGVCNPK